VTADGLRVYSEGTEKVWRSLPSKNCRVRSLYLTPLSVLGTLKAMSSNSNGKGPGCACKKDERRKNEE